MIDRFRQRPTTVDALIAAAAVAVGQIEAWTAELGEGSRIVTVLAALAATGVLALRRRQPIAAALVVLAAFAVKERFGAEGDVVVLLVAGVVTVFAVGAREPSPRSERALLLLLAVAATGTLLSDEPAVSELLFTSVVTGAPWVAGRLLRDRTERAAMAEELAARREREAQQQARLAAAEERARIARELHDLVGHAVSVMVLQAGAAEQVAREGPEQVASALTSIQDTGRAAIEELRRVLGLLREEGQSGDLEPLPDLHHLDALVEGVRAAGVDLTVEVDGDPMPLPAGVSLAAFRIVQEALTNVVKHAGGARAGVRIGYRADSLSLEVVDDGSGGAPGDPTGHGLVGIRERAAMCGGRVQVGRRPGGGFRVAAELPLQEAA